MKPDVPKRLLDHVCLGVLTKAFPPKLVTKAIDKVRVGEQRPPFPPSWIMDCYSLKLPLLERQKPRLACSRDRCNTYGWLVSY